MKCILVVDDSATNLKFVESVLKDSYKLVLVKSGEMALKYLVKNPVDLVLLDILMPEMDGFETFEKIKQLDLNHEVPVVFLTADVDVDNEIRGLKMGAVDFIRKPFVPEVMLNRINHILQLEELNKNLEDKVKEKTTQVERLSFEIISTIASMIEARDSYTKGHSVRVSEYSALIAKKLGWSEEEIQNLKNIALLHDIGKVGIPDNVLNKPGRLTDNEFNIIKSHTTIGGEILKEIQTIPDIDAGARYHHERYDGKGYPCGLSGEHIPNIARIIGIADSYDAMSSKRVYRDSLPREVIRNELVNGRGTQFDPEYLDVFIQLFDEGKLDIELAERRSEITFVGENSEEINQIMKAIEAEVEKAQTIDYLTGLLGRKEGENKIAQAMKENPGCLAFVDVDNLKQINDTMGHLAGDYVLKIVGEILSKFSDHAIASRLTGDEFLFYMMDTEKDDAIKRIEEIVAAFQEEQAQHESMSEASLSIGLCSTSVNDTYANAVRNADRALYHIKQTGKNGYYFYNQIENEEEQRSSIDLERLVTDLKTRIRYNGTLSVEYKEFTKIYDYICHLGERYDYNIHLVMITLESVERDALYIDEREHAMSCMEKTIKESLRAVDVSTRFSGEQFMVILMNAQKDDIEMVQKRIIENFHKVYDRKILNVLFDVAELSGLK